MLRHLRGKRFLNFFLAFFFSDTLSGEKTGDVLGQGLTGFVEEEDDVGQCLLAFCCEEAWTLAMDLAWPVLAMRVLAFYGPSEQSGIVTSLRLLQGMSKHRREANIFT